MSAPGQRLRGQGRPRAFFNHAGGSPMSAATVAAIQAHLMLEADIGAMEAAAQVQSQVDGVRAEAAALLNAAPADVAFMSSASSAIGLAFAALPALRPGDRILVGRHEWGGNVATYQQAAQAAGATLDVIPCRPDGSVDPSALATMLDERVRLVSLTWMPANGGLVNDAEAIGRVTRAAGVPYFVDAGQALGQWPVDVQAIGCDVLKGAARKFLRGPRGTALLYVRPGFVRQLRPAFLDVRSGPWRDGGIAVRQDAQAFETAEQPVALLLGLGVALREARALGLTTIRSRIAELSRALRAGLAELGGVELLDLGTEHSGLVSFRIAGQVPDDTRAALAVQGITVGSNGPAYTPFDMQARGLAGIVRASVHHLNTESDLEHLLDAVRGLGRPATHR